MSASDPQLAVREWLQFAASDLNDAESLLAGGTFAPHNVCFLSQQAAEKALKAVLLFVGDNVPREHSLNILRDLVPEGWSVKTEFPTLSRLTIWAVVTRYPGNAPAPTQHDAANAVAQARAVLASVTRDLAEHGLTDEPNT